MKQKNPILTLMALALALFSQAQTHNATLFPALNDSITYYSVSAKLQITGTTGSSDIIVQHGRLNDTLVTDSALSTNALVLWVGPQDSLSPVTQYRMRAIVTNNGASDTTQFITFTTKAVPPPVQQFTVAGINVDARWDTSWVNFNHSAEYPIRVTAYIKEQNYPTASYIITGTGNFRIPVTFPNEQDSTYRNNLLYVEPVGNVPSYIQDRFYVVPNYTVPRASSPSISATLVGDSIYSARATVTVTLGDNDDVAFGGKVTDSAGIVRMFLAPTTITHDSTFSFRVTNLENYSLNSLLVYAVGFLGVSDTFQTPLVRTRQVDAGTIQNWNVQYADRTSASVQAFFKANGSSMPSMAKGTIDYVDASGTSRTTDTLYGILGPNAMSKTFTLDNLREYPYGNPATIRMVNEAGLSSALQISIVAREPVQGFVPGSYTITKVSPSEVILNGITCSPMPNDTAELLVAYRIGSSSHYDTLTKATNITGHATFSPNIQNLPGGEVIYFKPIGRSMDGKMKAGVEKSTTMISPINPTFTALTKDSVAGNKIYFHVFGNGNGTQATITLQLFRENAPVTSPFTDNLNTGSIHYAYSYELDYNAEYKISASMEAPGFQSNRDMYVTLDLTTGIPRVIVTFADDEGYAVTSSAQKITETITYKDFKKLQREHPEMLLYFVKTNSAQ